MTQTPQNRRRSSSQEHQVTFSCLLVEFRIEIHKTRVAHCHTAPRLTSNKSSHIAGRLAATNISFIIVVDQTRKHVELASTKATGHSERSKNSRPSVRVQTRSPELSPGLSDLYLLFRSTCSDLTFWWYAVAGNAWRRTCSW